MGEADSVPEDHMNALLRTTKEQKGSRVKTKGEDPGINKVAKQRKMIHVARNGNWK